MDSAEAVFVVKFPTRRFEAAFCNVAAGLSAQTMAPIRAFEGNLRAVVRILTLPYQLSGAAIQQRRIDQLYRAELIRSLDLEDSSRDNSPERHSAAMAKALEAFRAEFETEQGLKTYIEQAIADLSGRLHLDEITTAAADLLRQATSMTWTSLEILFRDLVTVVLNANPSLVPLLLRDDRARQILDLKRIDTEVLVDHGFDLKGKMGNIIGSHDALARLDTMRVLFRAFCPEEAAVSQMLDERELWLLAQQRHLIVHRRGIVDAQYLDNTGDSRQKGSLLAFTPTEVVEQILLVQRVGLGVARALSGLLETTPGPLDNAEGKGEP